MGLRKVEIQKLNLVVNVVLRHGAYHERNYRPVKQPFPYDMATVQTVLKQAGYPVKV